MKKILNVLLSTLMVFTCLTANTIFADQDMAKITENETEYTIGLADDDENANLHIVNNNNFNVNDDYGHSFHKYLVAGHIQAATAEINKTMTEGISDVEYELIDNTFPEGKVTLTADTTTTSLHVGANAYGVVIAFEPGASGSVTVKTSFKYNNTDYVTYNSFEGKVSYDLNIDLTAAEMEVSNFNNIFKSYADFKTYVLNKYNYVIGDDLDAKKYNITINLPEGTYSGDYVIDLAGYNGNAGNNIMINGNHQYVNPSHDQSGNTFYEGIDVKTQINGSIRIKGGCFDISFLKMDSRFSENSSTSTSIESLGISDAAIGIYALADSKYDWGSQNLAGVNSVSNVEFTAYDYAVLSSDKGIICDIQGDKFVDCGYGYYMDCQGEDLNIGGSNSEGNTFINCENGVAIISTPKQLPAYSLRFINNYFYIENRAENSESFYDFVTGQNNSEFFFQKNYFGSDTSDMEKVRSARINYKETTNSKVITNPCVRYPSEEVQLGIDPNDSLYTKIFAGTATNINEKDLGNIKSLGIQTTDGKTELGRIVIGD